MPQQGSEAPNWCMGETLHSTNFRNCAAGSRPKTSRENPTGFNKNRVLYDAPRADAGADKVHVHSASTPANKTIKTRNMALPFIHYPPLTEFNRRCPSCEGLAKEQSPAKQKEVWALRTVNPDFWCPQPPRNQRLGARTSVPGPRSRKEQALTHRELESQWLETKLYKHAQRSHRSTTRPSGKAQGASVFGGRCPSCAELGERTAPQTRREADRILRRHPESYLQTKERHNRTVSDYGLAWNTADAPEDKRPPQKALFRHYMRVDGGKKRPLLGVQAPVSFIDQCGMTV